MDSVHNDIILTDILPRLDGPSLASLSCCSSHLRDLIISSDSHHLFWSRICHATWPSLNTPRLRDVVFTFPPDGPRSFFSQSYSSHRLLRCSGRSAPRNGSNIGLLTEFISAVDIRHNGSIIFYGTAETADTDTSWFRCAPFRIDLLDDQNKLQDAVRTTSSAAVKHPTTDDECGGLLVELTLSWIVIDPVNGRAAYLSSGRPVSVERHWLSGEAMVRFYSILGEGAEELVKCEMRVTLGDIGDQTMEVREVSLVMEDMDGKHLNGEGSLVNLEWALEGNRGSRSYEEFVEKKRERKEREVRREERLDLFCVSFGVAFMLSSFVLFLDYIFC